MLTATCEPEYRRMDDLGLSTALGAGERARRTDACQVNRVHSFSLPKQLSQFARSRPGTHVGEAVRAEDSHSSDHGEEEVIEREETAPPTDCGRGDPTRPGIRGGRAAIRRSTTSDLSRWQLGSRRSAGADGIEQAISGRVRRRR